MGLLGSVRLSFCYPLRVTHYGPEPVPIPRSTLTTPNPVWYLRDPVHLVSTQIRYVLLFTFLCLFRRNDVVSLSRPVYVLRLDLLPVLSSCPLGPRVTCNVGPPKNLASKLTVEVLPPRASFPSTPSVSI